MFIKNKSVYKVFIRFYFYIFKKISGKILKTHNDWWGSFLFEIWFRYFINTTLLVDIHILYAQKWAAPFPCSKTKSEISFSLGWAQEGLNVVPIFTTYAVPLRRCLLFYTKLFAKNQRLPVPIQTPQFAMII